MEATLLRVQPHFYIQGGNSRLCNTRLHRNRVWAKPVSLEISGKRVCSSRKHVFVKENKGSLLSNCFPENQVVVGAAASTESINIEPVINTSESGQRDLDVNGLDNVKSLKPTYRNRFLNFLRIGTITGNVLESFFKSEIRTRLFVTAVLLVVSRLGYFVPLPGFDRRLMPENYLNFLNGSTDELGKLTPELELSLFQLGLSPQIAASILMQLFCVLLPPLVKLRKEGLDAQEKIKSYIWWISLAFAITQALILSCYSLPYSIYAGSHRVKHVMITTFYLVCGAMTMAKISDKITESGFGQGSSLIICVNILTGYTDTLYKMLAQFSAL